MGVKGRCTYLLAWKLGNRVLHWPQMGTSQHSLVGYCVENLISTRYPAFKPWLTSSCHVTFGMLLHIFGYLDDLLCEMGHITFACSEGYLNLNMIVCRSSFPTLSGIGHIRWYFHCSLHALDSSHFCHLFIPVFLVLLPFHMSNFRIKTATQLEGFGVSYLLIWISFKSTHVVF